MDWKDLAILAIAVIVGNIVDAVFGWGGVAIAAAIAALLEKIRR